MPHADELTVLVRTARQLSKLCQQGAGLVEEARDSGSPGPVMAAARKMHSDLMRSKHAAEDELAFVLDCDRCGRRVHWVPGEGCALGHWAVGPPSSDRPESPICPIEPGPTMRRCWRRGIGHAAEDEGSWVDPAYPLVRCRLRAW